jgi:hypothetical protein
MFVPAIRGAVLNTQHDVKFISLRDVILDVVDNTVAVVDNTVAVGCVRDVYKVEVEKILHEFVKRLHREIVLFVDPIRFNLRRHR